MNRSYPRCRSGFAVEQLGGELLRRQAETPTPGEITRRNLAAASLQASQAGIQASIAQARLDQLSAQADTRRLAVAGDINCLTGDRLNLQNQLAPMLVQEQSLQDQIRVITRENLDLTKDRLQAQLAAIAPTTAVAQFGLPRTLAEQNIQLGIAQAVTGQPQTVDLGEQFGKLLSLVPALNPDVAQAGVDATVAQTHVLETTSASNTSQITRALQAIGPQKALQGLELGPGGIAATGLALAANDVSAAAIERSLQLTTVLFAPESIAAEQALANARERSAAAAEAIATSQA